MVQKAKISRKVKIFILTLLLSGLTMADKSRAGTMDCLFPSLGVSCAIVMGTVLQFPSLFVGETIEEIQCVWVFNINVEE